MRTATIHMELPQRHAPCVRRAARLSIRCSAATKPLVKVCGVTNAADASHAVYCGADMIGMIMWPKAKRAVSDATAASISAAAVAGGALPVGVFVDEDAATINQRCRASGISIAQLHGDGARQALQGLDPELQVVYVLQVDDAGQVVTALPSSEGKQPDWLLLDGMQGGSGKALPWAQLQVPQQHAKRGWLLAGGLTPWNVAEAARTAHPTAVDVSSGVCRPDGLRKDHDKVAAFVTQAKQVTYKAGPEQTS